MLGTVSNTNETVSPSLVRINADATLDGTFSPVLPSGYVLASAGLAASPGGKVILYQGSINSFAALCATQRPPRRPLPSPPPRRVPCRGRGKVNG